MISNPIVARSRSQRGVADWAVVAERYANGLVEVRFFQMRVMVGKLCFTESRYPVRRQNRRTFVAGLGRQVFTPWDEQAERLVDEALKAVGELLRTQRNGRQTTGAVGWRTSGT